MSVGNPLGSSLSGLGISDINLLAIDGNEAGQELAFLAAGSRRSGLRADVPIFLRDKRFDFLFAHDHKSGSNALDASCGKALLDFRPQQRADLIANQTIQHTASLLCVHTAHIQLTRSLQRILNGLFGDLVELNTTGLVYVHIQDACKMPGDRLTFTVRVSCEVNLGSIARFLADTGQNIAATTDCNILQFEIVVHIHANLTLGQIADMALRCLHLIALAEELADRTSLGRRFDNNQFLFCSHYIASDLISSVDSVSTICLSGHGFDQAHHLQKGQRY